MKKNKGKKTFVAMMMFACIAITFVFGRTFGKKTISENENFSFVKQQIETIFNNGQPVKDEQYTGEAPIVELQPIPETSDSGYDTTEIYQKVSPSVVCINVYSNNSVSPMASGTGIVMTRDGYIITNAHVVSNGSYVNVVFSDGNEVRGDIIGADEDTDLAVVKVNASDLTPAEFGDSTQLLVGERAVVIGNAGGLSGSCTTGIISGLNREISSSRRSLNLIQTSAAINPGNSGGPLLNRFGQVVGITSSKVANVDYEGIGFAIPISDAVPIVQSLISNGYVSGRAVLGISVIELNSSNGPANGLPSYGAYIASIADNSYMLARGVRERDVITKANGTTITDSNILLKELNKFNPGDSIELEIYRPETGATFTVNVQLIESTTN